MSYLRQLTQQAVGQRLPGQPRPMRPTDSSRSPLGSREAVYDDSALESVMEETEARRREPDHRASSSATPERLLAPASPAAASASPAEGSLSVRAARDQERDASPTTRRAATPGPATAPTRFDSLEALLPAILNPRRASQDSASIETADSQPSRDHDAHEGGRATPGSRRDTAAPARAPASEAAKPARARRGEPEAAAAPAVPDVHIHIGRVELTALQPPAPRPAPRREEKKPMSLEEYLRQRDGRRN